MAEVPGQGQIKTSETKSDERHPFQELLYGLRNEGLRVSTDEWLDLQKALEKGMIENLDEMYFVSRAVLVKDVSDYPTFDTVFGKMFFGIEPPPPVEVDDYNDYQEEEIDESGVVHVTDDEDQKDVIQKEEENIDVVTEDAQGLTEETHGGNEATKDIENSPNAANHGMQQNLGAEEGKSTESKHNKGEGGGQKQQNAEGGGSKDKKGKKGGNLNAQNEGGGKLNEESQGGDGTKNPNSGGGMNLEEKLRQEAIKHGKGGFSAREIIQERRHDVYDKDKVLGYEQFGRALAKLVTTVQESSEEPTHRLDVTRTVNKVASNAGAPELIWSEETEEKPQIIILFDVGGSTDRFRPIMEKLFAASVDVLDARVFYFHNAPYDEVWPQKDGNYGKNFVPLNELIKKNDSAKVIIVGDAWMAEDELWGYGDEPSGIDSLKKIRANYDNVVWINPILEKDYDEWDNSGTIRDIQNIFPMFDLTLRGIEKATQELMDI